MNNETVSQIATIMIIEKQGAKIKELQKENANLLRCLDGKPVHWTNIIYDKNKEIEQLEQEKAKLKEQIDIAKSILSELNDDFDSMEHSYIGKDSDYHKRIKAFLKKESDNG
jgi:predicted nuclease with TOPRIM domain